MSNTFDPRFVISNSIAETAHYINSPHDDFPRRVDVTGDILTNLLIDDDPDETELSEFDIKSIHSLVMWDIGVDRGRWRTGNVKVGYHIPPPHYKVADEIEKAHLFPIRRDRNWVRKPHVWYKKFQEIHPFIDGNGRVGGIVLAFLTYDPETATMLAPLQ